MRSGGQSGLCKRLMHVGRVHDSVAGTHAGLGESRVMTTRNASTSMGRGRDTLPLRPIPKQNRVVYTEQLTHLIENIFVLGRAANPLLSFSHDQGSGFAGSSRLHLCASNAVLISCSASSSTGWCDLNCMLHDSQVPRAIGMRFTILRLRFAMPAVSHSLPI